MGMAGGKLDGEPMIDMNMTPLIDVLLVLLIMFIITIPVATHAVNIDLPSGTPPENPVDIDPVKNKLFITEEDELLWNGNPITDANLVSLLQDSLALPTEPELQYEPSAQASYKKSAETLDVIKAVGVTKFGFVGNERYRVFGKAADAE